jgi:hypothetical protein
VALKITRTYPQEIYGHIYHESLNDLTIEFDQFKHNFPGGEGRFFHLQKIVKMLWPDFEWHDWSELLLREFCSGEKHITVSGCSGSGKSTCAAIYVLVWWMCDYPNSLVCVTSTSLTMAARRIWGQITKFYRDVPGMPGKMLDSEFSILASKGDRIHSISIIPGSREKTVEGLGKIKGWHADRVLVIADELQDMTNEVIDGLTNVMTGAKEAQFIGLGNPVSQLDTHGQECEPVDGWDSIGESSERWRTKKGVCIRLDGLTSPNLAGAKVYKGLLSQADLDKTRKDPGEDSMHWWTMCRGMWAPAGAEIDRVVSYAILQANKCFSKVVWDLDYSFVGGLDPAYGGDRCVLRFAKIGKDSDHKSVMELEPYIIVPMKLSDSTPVEHQIGQFCIDECKKRAMMPRDFSLDSTAQGRAVLNYMTTTWGPVNAVEFGGLATDMPINAGSPKKGKDEYVNRVTELWYSVRRFAEAGQLRGLDKDTAKELTSRRITLLGKPSRIVVESKADCKKTLGKSPDLGDVLSVLTHSARLKGILNGEAKPVNQQNWSKTVKRVNAIYKQEYAYRD